MAQIVHAVASILQRNDKVLIASRPEGKSHSGCWEFPGGKVESGESLVNALIRELKEEIGVIANPQSVKRLMYIRQPYPDLIVHLDIMQVEDWENEPFAAEGQELFWQPINSFCVKSPLLLTTQKILDILKADNIDARVSEKNYSMYSMDAYGCKEKSFS